MMPDLSLAHLTVISLARRRWWMLPRARDTVMLGSA
jgi:hypothetical protein